MLESNQQKDLLAIVDSYKTNLLEIVSSPYKGMSLRQLREDAKYGEFTSKIVGMYNTGKRYGLIRGKADLASKFGYSERTLDGILQDAKGFGKEIIPYKMNAARTEQLLNDYNTQTGKSVKDIAKDYNISTSYLYKLLRKQKDAGKTVNYRGKVRKNIVDSEPRYVAAQQVSGTNGGDLEQTVVPEVTGPQTVRIDEYRQTKPQQYTISWLRRAGSAMKVGLTMVTIVVGVGVGAFIYGRRPLLKENASLTSQIGSLKGQNYTLEGRNKALYAQLTEKNNELNNATNVTKQLTEQIQELIKETGDLQKQNEGLRVTNTALENENATAQEISNGLAAIVKGYVEQNKQQQNEAALRLYEAEQVDKIFSALNHIRWPMVRATVKNDGVWVDIVRMPYDLPEFPQIREDLFSLAGVINIFYDAPNAPEGTPASDGFAKFCECAGVDKKFVEQITDGQHRNSLNTLAAFAGNLHNSMSKPNSKGVLVTVGADGNRTYYGTLDQIIALRNGRLQW